MQDVINNAQNKDNDLLFIRSNCASGELYLGCSDYDKAKFHLEAALKIMDNCNLEKDLFDFEKLPALKILTELKNSC